MRGAAGILATVALLAVAVAGCGSDGSAEATRDLIAPISDGVAIAEDLMSATNANQAGLDEVESVAESTPDDLEVARDDLLEIHDADAAATAALREAYRSLDQAAEGLRDVADVISNVRAAAVKRQPAPLRAALAGFRRARNGSQAVGGELEAAIDELEAATEEVEVVLGDSASESDQQALDELSEQIDDLRGDLSPAERSLVAAVREEGVAARELLDRLKVARFATQLPDGACTQIPDDELGTVIGGGMVTVYPANIDCATAAEVVRAAYADPEYVESGSGTYLGFECVTAGTFENFITECTSGESSVSFTAPGSA